jgi:hypothetical protein
VTPKIAEILNDPTTSYWLSDALRSALNRDCLDAARDAELLAQVLKERCDLVVYAENNIMNLKDELRGNGNER